MFFWKRELSVSWVIVFLGNPGLRYENTRHNVGFFVADIIEKKTESKINRVKYNSLTAVATLGKQRVFCIKPQTYMNLSGGPVRQAMRFYKVPLSNVIVVTDDAALPVGKLRIRRMGASGGHNGVKDIISKCGGEGFPRIKVGVGSPQNEEYDMADWVLSKLAPQEEAALREAAADAAHALEVITNKSIEQAMGLYN
jgi:PTH1 family peptidyl-tRNA hydrolase